MSTNPLGLNPRQAVVLQALLDHRSMSSEDLQQAIYGVSSPQGRATVGMHISGLRKALASHGIALDFDWDARRYRLTSGAKKRVHEILTPPDETAAAGEAENAPIPLSELIERRCSPVFSLDRDGADDLNRRRQTMAHLQDIHREHGYNARWQTLAIGKEPGRHFRFSQILTASPTGSSAAMCAEASI